MSQTKLNQRQRLFIGAYLKHGNAGQAAREAGYADRSADMQASRLLKNDKIRNEIKRIRAKTEKATIANRQERQEILTEMLYDESATKTEKQRAIDILNKMDGDYLTKIEHSGAVGISQMSDAELLAQAEKLLDVPDD